MLKSFCKIALRNLVKNKLHSFLNIAGLSAGIAVAMLIALWVWDERSFDKYHTNYNSIAQVMLHQTINNEVRSQVEVPIPLGDVLRNAYGSNFKKVVMSSLTQSHILSVGRTSL